MRTFRRKCKTILKLAVGQEDNDGHTPQQLAELEGHEKIADMLRNASC